MIIFFLTLLLASHGACQSTCNGTTECISFAPHHNVTDPLKKQGYTQQPRARGTMDIVWTCGFTLFLCSWSTICLQIPAQDDHQIKVCWRKLGLTLSTLIAPEVSFCAALNQYIWARRCEDEFHASGFEQWTLTHAYFADQGGFLLQTPDYPVVPLDGMQLHYLVVHKYIDMPTITRKAIMDRNKVDAVLRLIAQWQTLWFFANMIFRLYEGIHITSLELTTVAFITCSGTSAFFWWHKPADVTYADTILCNTPMATIVLEGRGCTHGYFRFSPLDFISYEEWAWTKIWHHWINILRHLGINLIPEVPTNRRQNTSLYKTTTTELIIFMLFWNHAFPTKTELYLWRFAAIESVVLLFLCVGIEKFGFDTWPALRNKLLARQHYQRLREAIDWYPENQLGLIAWRKLDRLKRACRNNTAFDNSGYKDWTLTHSFYADAGGFILHTPDFPPFPVNGLQLHYLVTNNFIPMPKLSKKHIADRNKVDGMLRLISLWQILWFCMNEFFRYLDGLHIAALELTTVANIVVTMPSTFCWFFKPQDITIPEVIFCSTPISTIVLSAAVRPGAHYRYTPLDFVDRKEWTWSKQWTHYMNLPRHILRPLKWDPFTLPTPRPRIQTTHVPALSGRAYTILSLITLAYMSMFVLAWNHEFPSSDELLLWRLCSLGALVLGVLCLFFEHLGWIWWPYIQQRLMSHARYRAIRQRIIWQPRWGWERRLQSWVQSWTKAMRNNTIDQDPEMDIPLLTQIPLYLIGGTYCVTRAIMVGLDVAELRWMPISAYDEAKWSNLLPHV
ncbi:hypothetical protein KVT40_003067 [Elsinoe batatas]|uniref:Uncharacterized protein n=1 Tax=Elsinoe batatas TaxID=2601811 RepID=A0A8K0L578_9PEZI|nr:hypothetical protein KVT40_003067 [Elsinoe batatas]